jgi:Trk-type K+ transport system membrane component
LGIYSGDTNEEDNFEPESSSLVHRLKRNATLSSIVTTSRKVIRKPDFFVMTQIQRQLTSEIGWVVCFVFLVSVAEWEALMSPSPISLLSVIYECVSAFGGIGASLGYPETFAAQSQQYRTISKIFLIILMYRGRHRGINKTKILYNSRETNA